MEKPEIIITKAQALSKIQHYCVYQERSQQEVRTKLQSFYLPYTLVEELIAELIQENFLNEERLASAYAEGKFRMKSWGKNKIKKGLRLKQVPEALIKKALRKLEDDDYLKTLQTILSKKAALLNEKDSFKRRHKLIQYALLKGFENDLILDVLNNRGLA